MTLPKFLICQFRPGAGGVLCEQPIGQPRGFGRVYPDRTYRPVPDVGPKYLCRLVDSTERLRAHFVVPMKTAKELLEEFVPALVQARWVRGKHVTEDIMTEVFVDGYGMCQASWYQSTGRYKMMFVTLKFVLEGENIEISVNHSEAPDEVSELEKRVRECVGPSAASGAAWSRQSETPRSAWR